MAKVTIDWGEEYPMDEFKVTYPIARAVFTMLARISETWVKWRNVKRKDKELYLCDPEKNDSCRKTNCQVDCFMCTQREFARDDIKLCFNGDSFVPYFSEADIHETEKDSEITKTLNDINKITEFRKDEENKTPEL